MANKHMKRCSTSLVIQFSSVQSLSCVQLSATPWTAAYQAFLSITNSRSLFKLMSIESVMPSNHLILCRPLLLLPSIFPSFIIREMQSKTTKTYFIPIRMLYLKKKTRNNKYCKHMEKLESSYLAVGNVKGKWHTHCVKQFGRSSKH